MYLSIVSMYHLYLLLQFYIYRLSIYLSFYLSIQLSIYPSICISTYISVYCHERARLHVKKVHWYVYKYIYCLFNHFHKYHITGEMIRRIVQYWRGTFSTPVSLCIILCIWICEWCTYFYICKRIPNNNVWFCWTSFTQYNWIYVYVQMLLFLCFFAGG